MNTCKVSEKIKKINKIIQIGVKTEPEADIIRLICLSASVSIYLRNNEIEKLKNIENEIDDAIKTYEKYLVELKLPD